MALRWASTNAFAHASTKYSRGRPLNSVAAKRNARRSAWKASIEPVARLDEIAPPARYAAQSTKWCRRGADMPRTVEEESTAARRTTVPFPALRFSSAYKERHEGSEVEGSFASTAAIASESGGASSDNGRVRRVSTCRLPKSREQSLRINFPEGVAEA